MEPREVTELEWDEACENFRTAETVFFYMREYFERGWLSEAGFEQAFSAYRHACAEHDQIRAAYMADGLRP